MVFFGDKSDTEVLASLEGIDDDLDGHEIPFVMSDDPKMAEEYDIETFPAVVAFQASRSNRVRMKFFANIIDFRSTYLSTTNK